MTTAYEKCANLMNDLIRQGYSIQQASKSLMEQSPPSVNIAYDASLAMGDKAGCSFFSEQLLHALQKEDIRNRYCIYRAFGQHCHPQKGFDESIFNAQFIGRFKADINRSFARKIFEYDCDFSAFMHYPDIVHSNSFLFVDCKSSASVYTLYDLSFLELPSCTTAELRNLCFKNMFNAAIQADVYIAISEYTKKIFLKYFPFVNEARVRVIPLGNRPGLSENINIDKELSSIPVDCLSPFWLVVGTIEPRKNLRALIEAYGMLLEREETYPLYIAGGRGWLNNEIYEMATSERLREKIRFLGYVTDKQLVALYKRCFATIYPSFYEGFGLPVLEALYLSVPVIASNSTSLPEVGGNAVLYINPHTSKTITDQMQYLQAHPEKREELKKMGVQQVRRFTWERAAKMTLQIYHEAIWWHSFHNRHTEPNANHDEGIC